MDKEYYLKNWDMYWQNYAKFNPDLASSNITSKRALMNHFNVRGYSENRKIEEVIVHAPVVKEKAQFLLYDKMFKEKI